MIPLPAPILCLVTDRALCGGRALEDVVAAALRGGVNMVQLREKTCCTREFIALAERLLAVTRPLGVPLIINDRVDVALAVGAEGVHVGQEDMAVPEVRRLLGADAIIGLSVESLSDARAAEDLMVDYLGLSPVFSTATKTDTAPALGLEGVAAIRAESRHPLLAIGGINRHTAGAVLRSGAHGLAVVSAICAVPDPEQAAKELMDILMQAHAGGAA